MRLLRFLALIAATAAGTVPAVHAAPAVPAAHAVSVRDDRGVTVTLAAPPTRIVSLLPSLTETVCALGACARLVGVDRYSNHPASVRDLPTLGGGIDPSVEAVLALKPDLVLMATSSRAVARLEALGLKVAALEPHSARDVPRVIDAVAALVGQGDGRALWREIDAGVKAAAASVPPHARGVRVYFEASRGPYAAGAASFVGETLTRLGAVNIVGPELGPFPKINPEYVVRANPALIMIGERNAEGLEERPGFTGLRALREQRVCRFTPDEGDMLARPGPRMAEAARIMARCIAEKAP